MLAKGYIGPMADTVSEGPLVRMRPAALGPTHSATIRGQPIRRCILVVGSALVVTPGSTTCLLSFTIVPLAVCKKTADLASRIVVLVKTPRGALGAITSPHFFLETDRAPCSLCHLARMEKMLRTDAMNSLDMELFNVQAAILPWMLLAPLAMPSRGCGTPPGCTCHTLGSVMAVNWPAPCGTQRGEGSMATFPTKMTMSLDVMGSLLILTSASFPFDMAKLHDEFVGVASTRLGRGEAAARQLEGWELSLGKLPLLPASASALAMFLVTHGRGTATIMPRHWTTVATRAHSR